MLNIVEYSNDENCKETICFEFLEQFNRAEFECVDEYTIAIARVILNFMDMPVYFLDSRIYRFLPPSDRLFVVESFPEKKPKENFRVTPSPVELGMPKNDWSYVSTAIAFQNIFFWQELMVGKTQPVKYAEVVIARLTGIGGILAHLSDFSKFLEAFLLPRTRISWTPCGGLFPGSFAPFPKTAHDVRT